MIASDPTMETVHIHIMAILVANSNIRAFSAEMERVTSSRQMLLFFLPGNKRGI